MRTPACTSGSPREVLMGSAVSVATGLISTGILFGSQYAGMDIDASILMTSLLGNFLGYTGDVIVAKQCFDHLDPVSGEYSAMSLDQWDLKARFAWYARSLASRAFIRFILTAIIDTVVSIAIVDIVSQLLDNLGIKFKFRDAILAGGVSIVTFNLFVNEVRFKYAYQRADNFTHDLIVFAWATVLIVVYTALRQLKGLPSRFPRQKPE